MIVLILFTVPTRDLARASLKRQSVVWGTTNYDANILEIIHWAEFPAVNICEQQVLFLEILLLKFTTTKSVSRNLDRNITLYN